MKTSESITKIAPALLAVQKAVVGTTRDKVGKIVTTKGSYQYNYSDLSSVLDEIKGPLNDNGIVILQSPTADASGVAVHTRLLHESGEWVEETLYMPVTQGTPQAYGSAITYCRRYSAQSMLGLKAEDDDGKEASKPATKADPVIDRIKSAGMSGADVNKEAFDGLGDEAQAYIQTYADEIKRLHDTKGDVLGYLDAHTLDAEEKMALWSLLPSNVRSAIKKAKDEVKPPVKAAA